MTEPYELNEPHYRSVMEMEPDKRYTYFLTNAADTGQVWPLRHGDGWVTFEHERSGREALPVWPHPRFAAEVADEFFPGTEPQPMATSDWLELTRDLETDGLLIVVMMRPDGDMLSVEPGRHRSDLEPYTDPARYVEYDEEDLEDDG